MLCWVHRNRLETLVLVLFLSGGLKFIPWLALILRLFIRCMRGLDWISGFRLCSWELWGTPQNKDQRSQGDLRRLIQFFEQFYRCLCVIGVPLVWREGSLAEKNSLSHCIVQGKLPCLKGNVTSKLLKRQRKVQIKYSNRLIEHIKTYKFMRRKVQITQKTNGQNVWNGNSQKKKCKYPIKIRQNAWSLR